MRMVSPARVFMTSPVVVWVSKYAISCLNSVFKYNALIRLACLSPVTIQQHTSVLHRIQSFLFLKILNYINLVK